MSKLLTLLSSSGGCAAKLGPQELQEILESVQSQESTSIFFQQHEDAGICQLSNGINLVQSIDVITPISDDPMVFGGVAVAHALNDLYAKGARPITGLFFLGIPSLGDVPSNIAGQIIQSAIGKLSEAGAKFMGGHTLENKQLEFGVSVSGVIEQQIVPNANCIEGDLLILTKPIGNGIISTALKLHNSGANIKNFSEDLVKTSENSMLKLISISTAMVRAGAHACTDVSGFGLIGHIFEMIGLRGLSCIINSTSVPVLPGVYDLADQMIYSSGCERNAAYWWQMCKFGKKFSHSMIMPFFDPQTSGGLIISISKENINILLDLLEKEESCDFSIIGQIESSAHPRIELI